MKETRTIKSYIIEICIIIASVIGIILLVFGLKGLYPFGDKTIAYSDMSQQTIPFYYYIYDMLHGKELPFFSWLVGSGSNMMGVSSQFSFFSPFNIIFYFTGRSNILMFANIVMIIKAVFVAISMYVYVCSFKVNSYIRVSAAVLYAFGAGTIIYYVLGYNMDIAIMLPLIMLGMNRLMSNGKSVLFIVCSTICMMVNIYYAAMIIGFVLIVGFLQNLLLIDKEKRSMAAASLLKGLIISALCGAVVWLPSFMCISNSQRFSDSTASGLLGIYMNAIGSAQSDEYLKQMMLVNMSLLIAVVIVSPIIAKKLSGKFFNKLIIYGYIITIIMTLSVIVPGTELLWHGGTRVGWPVRFVFIITFALADYYVRIAEQYFEAKGNISVNRVIAIISGIVAVVAVVVVSFFIHKRHIINIYNGINNVQSNTLILVAAGIVIYSLCLIFSKFGKYIIPLVLGVELVFNSIVWISPYFYETDSSVEYINNANALLAEIETERYERVKDYNNILNSNYAFGAEVNTVTNFIHTVDSDCQPFFEKIGYPSAWTRIFDYGGTLFTDNILGMKYVIANENPCDELFVQNTESIYENRYQLPPVMKVGSGQTGQTDNTFEFLNEIYSDMSNDTEGLFAEISISSETGLYEADIDEPSIIYMYCSKETAFSISVNEQDIVIPRMDNAENTAYYLDNVVCLGRYCDGHVSIALNNYEGNIEDVHVAVMSIDKIINLTGAVNNGFEASDVSYGAASVKFSSNCSDSSVVMLPVFNSDGWHCKVNGTKTDITEVYGGFLGVTLDAGQNDVRFYFIPEGLIAGLIMTIIGLIIVVISLILRKKKYNSEYVISEKEDETENETQVFDKATSFINKCSEIIIMALGIIIAVLLFLVPIVSWIIHII